jgi:hypothetical protein
VSLDWLPSRAVEPPAQSEEDRQALKDRGDFFTGQLAEDTPERALVNRSQVVD